MRGLAIIGGFIFAGMAQFIAFAMTGAGHGWMLPFLVSASMFLLYPIALLRLGDKESTNRRPEAALLLVGALLDLVLLLDAFGSYHPFGLSGLTPALEIWLLFWLGWQIIAARMLWYRLFEVEMGQ